MAKVDHGDSVYAYNLNHLNPTLFPTSVIPKEVTGNLYFGTLLNLSDL